MQHVRAHGTPMSPALQKASGAGASSATDRESRLSFTGRQSTGKRGNCRLCNRADSLVTIYDGPIRGGGATDNQYDDGFRVQQCGACGVAFLDPFPTELDEYYQSGTYWYHHHKTLDVARLQRKLGAEQMRWLAEIGVGRLVGKRVADFGCGAGLFLDLVHHLASATTGIDPANSFQAHLISRGHKYIQQIRDVPAASLDVAVSFDTLEHVENPREFLSGIYSSLVSGGELFLGVPNQRDFLKDIVPDYLSFFYHKSHLFYFSAETLRNLLLDTGFQSCETTFIHKYDLMNMVVWARDSRGQGTHGSGLFDRAAEDAFRSNLERQGMSSHVLAHARK